MPIVSVVLLLLAFPIASNAQSSQIVWISDVTSSVDEGGTISFQVNREGATDAELDVTVKIIPDSPIEGFNILTGGDATDGVEVTVAIPAGSANATGNISTIDNDIVNENVDLTLEVQATTGVLTPDSRRFPATASSVANNGTDAYVQVVRLGNAPYATRTISEGDAVDIRFMRCVGIADTNTIQTCDDATGSSPRAGASLPGAVASQIYVTTLGEFFNAQNLFDTMQAEVSGSTETVDAVSFSAGQFFKTFTVIPEDDDIDEINGYLAVRIVASSTRENEWVNIFIQDNDLPRIGIYRFAPGITEGGNIDFFITRHSTISRSATSIPVEVGWHTKVLGGELPTPSTRLLVEFEEGQESKVFRATQTFDDSLNDGDGMVRVDLDVPTSDYNVIAESAWVRVVDDDVPEITLSKDKDRIVEGDEVTWTLTRSCCTEERIRPALEVQTIHYFPDELWPDRVNNQMIPRPHGVGFFGIEAGDTSTEWKTNGGRGVGPGLNVVGPQGGIERRRLLPFPDDTFEGIPEAGDDTFLPRYTLATTEWLEFTITNSGVDIQLETDITSVTEGDSIDITFTRSGGAADLIQNWANRVRVNVEQTGNFLDESEVGIRTVRIAPGLTSAILTIPTNGDQVDRPDGSVTVTIIEGAPGDETEDTYDFDTRYSDLAGRYVHMATIGIRDDDQRGVTVSPTELTIEEGGRATYTVVLDLEPTGNVTIEGSRASGSSLVQASAILSGALTFTTSNWATAQVVTVSAGNDANSMDETAVIGHTISGADYAGETVDSVSVTVLDNDVPRVSLSLSDDTISEDGGSARVTASLSQSVSQTTTIEISASPDSPATNADYSLSSNKVLTIAPGAVSSTGTVSITAVDNDLDDTDKTVSLAGSITGDSTIVAPPDVSLTIEDDDVKGVSFSTAELEINEDDDGTYTVELDTQPTDSVTVMPFRNSGDIDVTVSGAVTFSTSNWSTAQSVTVEAADDSDQMNDTAMIGHVVTGGDYNRLTAGSVNVTVRDNDLTESTRIVLTATPDELAESANETEITVTAELNGHARDAPTPVVVNVGSGTATSVTDFAAVSAFTITIPANSRSGSGTFTLNPHEDVIDEPDETVTVGGSTGVSGLSVTAGSVTITDNDAAPTVTLSLSRNPILESDNDSTANIAENSTAVTATLNHFSSARTTVTISVEPDSPATSSDYTISANKVLTIEAGGGRSTGTVTITATDNSTQAADKTVQVKGAATNSQGIVDPADVSLTLQDDDHSQGVTIVPTSLTVTEGDSGTYTVVLDAAPTGSVTVTPSVRRISFNQLVSASVSGALTFTTSNWNTAQTVTVGAFEDSDQSNGLATIEHSVSGADYGSVTADDVTVTIEDDDAPRITLTLTPDTIAESDDSGTADVAEHQTTVTASLSSTLSGDIAIDVSAEPKFSAMSSDFTLSSNKTLTITAGQTASTGVVTISAVGNDVDSADKTIAVKGQARLTSGSAFTNFFTGPADVELTIEDDDTRGVRVSRTSLGVAEGGVGHYTVWLESQPTAAVTVTPSRTSGETDVTVSGALTFTTSNWRTAQQVTVSAAQDNDPDDDTAVIGHTVTGGDYASVTAGSVSVTVTDGDTASDSVTLSVLPVSVGEGAGATDITVTATLNGGTRPTTTPVTVNVGSGTATSGTDFAAVNAFTITIPANVQSQTGSFSLNPTQDNVDEPDETVAVDGSTTVNGISVTDTTVLITDDDATPRVTLSLSRNPIRESDDSGTSGVEEHRAAVTASLDLASSVQTTVTISVVPNSPATSSDYSISANKVLTIAAGATSSTGTVTITAVNNDVDAADKSVQVHGGVSNSVGIGLPGSLVLTLADDDTRRVRISRTSLGIGEGNMGNYTVALESQPTAAVTVTPSRTSGDPDVTVSGALTFTTSNWRTAQQVTVRAAQDNDPDDDTAVIGHSVTGGDYASVTAGSVSVTVDDDETASNGVTLSVSPDELSEGANATDITVTATLNGGTRPTTTPVTVNVGSGTATSGTDFAAVNAFTITIPANAQSHTGSFSLDPTQDNVDEPDETVAVDGSTTVNGISVTDTTVLITDDDSTPRVTLSLSQNPIRESDNTATSGVAEHRTTVTASLNAASSAQTTVTISVVPDSPATSSDYTISANKVLTIAAGATSSTGTVTITAVNNDIDTANKTVQVLGGVTNNVGIVLPGAVRLTLTDEDTRGVRVSRNGFTVGEGNVGHYTVWLESQPTAAVTVTPSRTSGDTDVTVSGALTFTASNWQTQQQVTVRAAHDSDPDNDTAVIGHAVTGGDYASVTAGSVSVTVDDDETASNGVTLSVSPDELSESLGATDITVTATLNGGTRGAATPIRVAVGSGTATSGTDFAAVNAFTITIPANAQSQTGSFSLDPTQDNVDEPDETVAVDGSTTVSGISVTDTTVLIKDDDATPRVTLSLSRNPIRESDNTATSGVAEHRTTVTASLNAASSAQTTVTISVGLNAPTTNSDFTISANKVLTIAAGATSSTGTVTITAVNNHVDAADKSIQIHGGVSNSVGVALPGSLVLTLADDDTRGVRVSRTSLGIGEGNAGNYTVALQSQPTAAVTVTPSRTSGDTDVTVSGALTFTTSNWRTQQQVTVRAAQDNDPDNDTAVIGHTVTGGDYASVTAGSVSVTVDDDETASDSVALSVLPVSVGEGASATDITVTATLNSGTRPTTTPVRVAVGSGTATSGTDFASVNAFTITIPANSLSQTGSFSLDPTQDNVDEPDETVAVDGSTTVNGISVTDTTVLITDDDATPRVTLSLSRNPIRESDYAASTGIAEHRTTVTASLNSASSVQTTVTISVVPDSPATSSDYTISANKVLTIAAGATSSTGTVTITAVNNDIDADNKSVQVLGGVTNDVGIILPGAVQLNLVDEDTRGVRVSRTGFTVGEGNVGHYTVWLESQPTSAVTVTPSRTSGDTDVTVSGALTFTASNWQTQQQVTVRAAQDNDPDNDTAVIGHAVTGGDYASVTAGSVSVTVNDDETASDGVTLSVSPDELSESLGATDITVTATLNGGTRGAATPIRVAVGSGTATSGTDFAAVDTFTITIPANAQSQTGSFSLDPTQDSVDEPDETVAVDGSTTVSGISVTDTTVLITDDDATPSVTLSLSRNPIRESDDTQTSGVAEHRTAVTASLNTASSAQTTVTISVGLNAPTTNTDFTISANKVLTIAAGATSSTGTVTITAVNNHVDAADKSIQIHGGVSNSVGVALPGSLVLTLADDDTRGVRVSRTSLGIGEGNAGNYTVALQSQPTAAVTVTPSRTSGDTDVTVSGALTFTTSNWRTQQQVTVRAAQDNDPDNDTAVIGHTVTGGDYASVTAGSVSVTVDDDETASDSVALSVLPVSVGEGASATDITVTATLNSGTRPTTTPVRVAVGSGTATSGTDFASVNAFTITIPANSLSQTGSFSLDPTQDNVDEPDETVAVDGSTTVNGISVTDTTVLITDDDATPRVTLSLSRNPIRESDYAASTGIAEHRTTVTASLNSASSVQTTVTISVVPDSPATSSDYTISANKVLTIAAGATSSTGTVTITAVNNDIDADNKSVQVLGGVTNDVGIILPGAVQLNLVDEDTRGVRVSRTGFTVGEGNVGHYTVWLESQPTAAVTVTPSRTSGDTDVTVSGALTFTASNWQTQQQVTVRAAQDSDPDDDTAVIGHTVTGGDYASVTAGSVSVTVDDDETASDSVTLSVLPVSVGEGASATDITVTATLNGGTRPSTTPVTVTVGSGTATSGTDFAAVSTFTVTIPADAQSQTGSFSLDPTQDSVDEPDETVAVDGSTTVSGISVTDTTVLIRDDDSTPRVTLSLSRNPIRESDNTATSGVAEHRTAVTASLDAASSAQTTVTISVTPISPATSSDLSISANKVLTIAAGATSSTGTVTITAVNNDVDAADKSLVVIGGVSNSVGVALPSALSLTLEDDDTRGVRVSRTSLGIGEGNAGNYTVALESQPTAAVTVTPSRTSGDTDVTVSGALTFTTSNWRTAQQVTVRAAQDNDPDDDTAVIGHSVTGGDYASFTAGSVSVTVNDDETASNGVTLSVSPDELSESLGAIDITVTATLNGGTRGTATPVRVAVGSGTATSGTDFAAVNAFTITIPANAQSQTGSFSLDPTQDNVDEPDETVAVDGSTTVSGISVTDTTVLIKDDDATPRVTLSLSRNPIRESDDTATSGVAEHRTAVTASLNMASSAQTTVTISVGLNAPTTNSDFTISANKVLTIAAGATSSTGTVTITAVNNHVDAADKSIQIHGGVSNSVGIGLPGSLVLTLADDDTRGVRVSRTSLGIGEGNAGNYTVALQSQPTAAVTVTPSRTSGETDVTVSGALTFTTSNWRTQQQVTVRAAQDNDPDDDTAVIGHTVTGGDYVSVTAGSVSVTVNDDETVSDGVTLSVSPEDLSEGASATDITVTATLNSGTRPTTTPVTVNVGSGTATSGTDFAAVNAFTITIPANSLSQTGSFSLDPTQDSIDEPDETVAVDGSTTVNGISVTDTTVEITDDDARPRVTLSLSRNSISERDNSSTPGVAENRTTVTASLDAASSARTTVTISVSPNAPATSSNYSISANKVLTIAAGATSSTGTVTISAVDNSKDTPDRTVEVKGVASNTVGIVNPADVTLTLEDDDGVKIQQGQRNTPSTGLQLTALPGEVGEGDGATSITVRAALDGQPRSSPTSVTVDVGSGTATSGTDFSAVSNFTITIASGELSNTGTFSLVPTQDAIDEPDETVSVSGSTTISNFTVTGTSLEITDDDSTPRVTLSLSRNPIRESDDSATSGVVENRTAVTASLDVASSAQTTVTISATAISPATSSDFSISANKILTIAAGATSSTGTVTITAVNNDVDAADKSVVVSGGVSNSVGVALPNAVSLTLTDDDTRGVRVSRTSLGIGEGNAGNYTVALESQPTAAVTVTPSRTSGDSDVTVSGALTFTTSNWQTQQQVTVRAAQDNDPDDDTAVIGHTVTGGDYASVTAGSVSVTVDDDETASNGVTLSVLPVSVGEGANATDITVTATLNGGTRPTTTPVTVNVGSGTATSGTDFAAVNTFTITIPANAQSQTGSFSLDPTQDSVDEPDETVAVDGSTTVNGISVTDTTVLITDDDATPSVTLSLSRNPIRESDDTQTSGVAEHRTAVTASLNTASSAQTTVTISVVPDSPATSSDYTISANKVLTIAAGATASTGTVTITAVNNDVDAADKSIQIHGGVSNSVGVDLPGSLVLTLADDDTRGVRVSRTSLGIGEGNAGNYTVALESQPTAAVTVTPSRTSGETDVTVSGALTFTTSNWRTQQQVTVRAAQDNDPDDDTAVIGHTVTGGDYASVTAGSVSVTVDDDETASDGVTLSVSPDDLSEGASATDITVTATLNGGTRPTTTPVTVNVGSGTATSGTDFAAVNAFTITIPANSLSHTGSFSLDPTQDSIDEPDETVAVDGSTTVNGISVTDTTVEITDDDSTPRVTLSLSRNPIRESDNTATSGVAEHRTAVTASLDVASSAQTTVTISVVPDSPATSSDYTISANKALTIAAGATSSTGTVTITAVNNDIDAANKSVQVLGGVTNNVGIGLPDSLTLTLSDEDTRGVQVSQTGFTIGEGNVGHYTVRLESQPTAAVTVTPSRTSGDSDVTVSGALTFTTSNWRTALQVTVRAAQDSDPDDDTAVIGHTVTGGDYASLAAGSVSVTVDDDETASNGVTLSVSPDELSEGANATDITVTATLNGGTRPATTPVTVTIGSGTATSGTDFAAVNTFTITIPANAQSQTGSFSLDPTQDNVDEPDETVAVDGSTTVNGISITDATVLITDDNVTPRVTLSLSRNPIRESDDIATPGVVENRTAVTASLDAASSARTTVTISVVPDSPATSSDYTISANKILTIAAGATASTGTVTITAVNNDVDAADKTVQVKGNASNTLGATDPADVSLTLSDDDTRGVTLSTTSLDVNEGDENTYTVTLDTQPTAPVTVTPSRSSGDTDVTVSGALTFTTSNWNSAQTVTVSAAQDNDPDNDTAVIGHTITGGDYASVTAGSISVTVDDDETASNSVTLSVTPDELSEGASATDITVTATLNGATRPTTTPVTITIDSDAATSDTDFTAVSAFTITIPENSPSHTGTFSLDPAQDNIDEPDETLAVNGSTTVSGLTVTDTTVTIIDDDTAPHLTLNLSTNPISENEGTTTVTASLSHPSAAATSVTVSVSPNAPADEDNYELSSNRLLTIAAGSTVSTGAVTIAAVDNSEADENKILLVQAEFENSLGIGARAEPTLTIENDDLSQPATENSPPAGADNSVYIDEDTTYFFTADDFGFVDSNEADSLAGVKIMSMPADGKLNVNGGFAAVEQVVDRQVIDDGEFTFIPQPNEHGEPYSSFDFEVSDGKAESEATNSITFNVISVNDPATGKPEISGPLVAGETLTALTSGINDIDGLTRVQFRYQWLREESGAEIEINGANGREYTVPEADSGRHLRVSVSFADDDDFAEELVSDPVFIVQTEQPSSPGRPLELTAIAGDGEVTLNWRPPTSNGGAEITDYEIRYAPGEDASSDSSWSSAGLDLTETVTDLDNGQRYTFQVRARNSAGAGPAATVRATTVAQVTQPGVPRDLLAVPEDGQAGLSWKRPLSDGGAVITDYEIRFAQGSSIPEETDWRSAGADLAEEVTGLRIGREYVFEVRAVNSEGPGPAARTSVEMPARPPDAPELIVEADEDGQAELRWQPPEDYGGAMITEYQYRYAEDAAALADMAWISAGTELAATVTDLVAGRIYVFEVRALNEAGPGPPALDEAEMPVPATVPGAPRSLTATGAQRLVTLNWQSPAGDGGSAISDYEYRFTEGPGFAGGAVWTSAGTDLGETVTGLKDGQLYSFEVRAVNSVGPGPAASASAETRAIRRIDGALIEGWLARFGRTASGDTAEAIRQRLEEGPQRTRLIVGGRNLTSLFAPREESSAESAALMRPPESGETAMDRMRYADGVGFAGSNTPAGASAMDGFGSEPGSRAGYDVGFEVGMENGRVVSAGMNNRRSLPKMRDLLLRSSFYHEFAENEEADPDSSQARTVWGSANSSRFDASFGSMRLDGEVSTGTAGFDRQWGRWLTGLAISHSEGEGRFRDGQSRPGEIASNLTGVYPYAYLQVDRRTTFWGAFGFGKGELQIAPDDAAAVAVTDLGNTMAAFGGRGVLTVREGQSGSFELALRSDALLTNTSSDAGVLLEEAAGATRRLRLMLEATGSIESEDVIFSPTFEAGFRHDAGDAEQGTGFEIGGGLAWTAGPLSLQLNGRGLLAHEDEAFREWGYSAGVQYQVRQDGRGLLLNLTSSRGAAEGGATRLWSMPDAGGLAREQDRAPGQSIRFEIGYGLDSAWRNALWYPYLGVETFSQSGKALRLGLKIRASESIDAGLEIGRRINGVESSPDAIQLRGTVRW